MLETVYADGQQTALREAKLKQDMAGRDKQLAAVQAETDKQIADYKADREKAEADRASEASKFAEFRKAIEKSEQDLQKSLADQRTKYEAADWPIATNRSKIWAISRSSWNTLFRT